MHRQLFIILAATAALAAAATPQWVGMTAEEGQPRNVSLFAMGAGGSRGATVVNFLLPDGFHPTPDAFRCKPYGSFCLLLATNGQPQPQSGPAAPALQSILYNISLSPPPAPDKVPSVTLDSAMAYNLHVHHTTGAAYTVLLSPGRAVVAEVFQGTARTLVDLSAMLTANSSIAPGGTTQCSNTNTMWIGIRRGKLANGTVTDLIAVVQLDAAKLISVFPLLSPLPWSLWASCAGTADDDLGGVAPLMDRNYTNVAYGTLNAQGIFSVTASGTLPQHTPPLQLTPLLSQPPGYDFFFPVYPQGSAPGGPAASGYLAFGHFAGGQLSFQPISYYLTGAAELF